MGLPRDNANRPSMDSIGSDLPDLSAPASSAKPTAPRGNPSLQKTPIPSVTPNPSTNASRTASRRQAEKRETFVDEQGKVWAVDARTGKKYRVLEGADKEAVKAAGKGGFTSIDDMRRYIDYGVDDEFDVDNLEATAEIFLGHLRVPPDPKEIQRIHDERTRRAKIQEEEYKEYVKTEDAADIVRRQKEDEQLDSRMSKLFGRKKK